MPASGWPQLQNGQRPLVFEDGLQTRDFVHVSDVVRANLLALESKRARGVYDAGSGRPSSVLEVIEFLSRRVGFSGRPEIANRYRAGDIRHC